ncbi:MAG TPA: hypothetical protein VGI80_00730 [Pyrinomonadaceae bacterium]|jgi:hypothetical protein
MKKLIIIAVFALTLSAAVSSVSAQRATRVNFRRGARSAVVTGYLTGYKGSKVFLIRVRAGQKMKVEAIGDRAVSTFLEGPPGSNYQQDMAADCHSHAEVESTDAGDYKLSVQECPKADRWKGTFKVRITIR